MKKSPDINLLYGFLALVSLLIAMLGYAYTHKPFSLENLLGILIAVWQTIVAFIVIALAGGLGEFFLKLENRNAWIRIGLDVALGIPVLSFTVLIVGSILGTGFLPISVLLVLLGFLMRKSIDTWFRMFPLLKAEYGGNFEYVIVLMASLILLMHFGHSMAPPIRFDALVYHFSLPKSYLEAGANFVRENNLGYPVEQWEKPETLLSYLLPQL